MPRGVDLFRPTHTPTHWSATASTEWELVEEEMKDSGNDYITKTGAHGGDMDESRWTMTITTMTRRGERRVNPLGIIPEYAISWNVI